MNKTGIPYLDFTWNPCGLGCSNGCPTCWARRIAARVGHNTHCPDCEAFRVHFHEDRISQPRRRHRAVVGVCFTADLYDRERPGKDIKYVLEYAAAAHHEFVFLTQNPGRMVVMATDRPRLTNWYLGTTIKTQAMIDSRIEAVRQCDWISFEPLLGPVTLPKDMGRVRGIIIGCDNTRSVPFDNDWAGRLKHQAQDMGLRAYWKQGRDPDGKIYKIPPRKEGLLWTLTTKGGA